VSGQACRLDPGQNSEEAGKAGGAEKKPGEPISLDDILRKYGVLEENSTPILNMCSAFISQAKPESVKLYTELFDEVKSILQPEEGKVEININKAPTDNEDEPKDKAAENNRNCSQVLAEYLCDMSKRVSERFFMTLIIFVRMYRDYMDLCGWDIIGKYKAVSVEEKKKQFSKLNDAEHIPEACNDFVKIYLPKEYPNFDQAIGVDVTLHLCEWLHRKKYTHTHISLL